MPHLFDLNATRSLSNLFNCDPGGALLYADAAQQQLADTMKQVDPSIPPKCEGFSHDGRDAEPAAQC